MKVKFFVLFIAVILLAGANTSLKAQFVNVFNFDLTYDYLETTDPTVPLIYNATIQNNLSAFVTVNIDVNLLGDVWGIYSPDPVGPIFLSPFQSLTTSIGSFDFFDTVTPTKIQQIQFAAVGSGFFFDPNLGRCVFGFESEFHNASAGLVPEPSSFLLLLIGLLGIVGYNIKIRKRA